MFDQDTLLEKLRKIEALYAGTRVDGEREAAKRAADRIRARLAELRGRDPDVTLRWSLPDPWKRKLFVALCRRYGLRPYREPGQRYSSVLIDAPDSFQRNTLGPEFFALADELDTHLTELTDRVIREAIHADVTEAAEAPAPRALGPAQSDGSHPTGDANSEA
jgi:hypothetical protein